MVTDRTGWAVNLRTVLDRISVDYSQLRRVAETGVDDAGDLHDPAEAQAAATAAATQALIQVVVALDELPEIKGSLRGGPLPDLIAAMDDLRRGQSPELFRPWPQRKGQLSARVNMLKMRAVTSVLVLERSGASNAEARKIAAKIFADAGHRGKKGAPVSASTMFGWCTDFASGIDETVERRIISATLSKLPDSISRSEAVRLAKAEAAKRL